MEENRGFWYWFFLLNTSMLLAGMFGLFGEDAKRQANLAAEDLAMGLVLLLVIAVILFLLYTGYSFFIG